MPVLVLMRHGATLWGQENRFAGWGDSPLSQTGFAEAASTARALAKAKLSFDINYTSDLLRAQQTLEVLTQILPATANETRRDWRLNERHYGSLQGETRAAMIEKYGNKQVVEWRRSYTALPPSLEKDDPRWHEQVQRLPNLKPTDQPATESMAIAAERVAPVWHTRIAPDLKGGKQVLVVAHTSSIRGLARAIEGLDDEACENFRIATAVPIVYILDADLNVVSKTDVKAGMAGGIRYWANQLKPRGLGWI
jgi:2,3-bisphosphoglycerate-dependent phosphoglycerate mutase